MQKLFLKYFSFLLILLFNFSNLSARQTPSDSSIKIIRVAVAGSEPFVFANADSGISLQIWDKIAQKNSWKYNIVFYNKVEVALDSLKKRKGRCSSWSRIYYRQPFRVYAIFATILQLQYFYYFPKRKIRYLGED